MNTYLLLDAVFLAPAVILQALVWRRRPRGHTAALLATTVVLVALTIVFDTLMIAAHLFTYAEDRISGVRILLTPIEDVAYPIAVALLATAIWNLGRPASPPREPADAAASGGKADR